MLYFYTILSIKKDDSLNPSSSLKVLWKPLTIDFTWIYCTIIIIALSPLPFSPVKKVTLLSKFRDSMFFNAYILFKYDSDETLSQSIDIFLI